MKNAFWYGGIGLLLGIAVAWIGATVAVNGRHEGAMRMMGMNASTMHDSTDRHFIEQMIPHHEDAITMAALALQKGEHEEIRALARDITSAQTEENQAMKQWYKNWFGADVPDVFSRTMHSSGTGMMHGGMMGSQVDIDNLKSANPFDKAFIEQMIPHHQMAIMMAQMLQAGTDRKELEQLAENIITTQTREIDHMRGWYNAWYK